MTTLHDFTNAANSEEDHHGTLTDEEEQRYLETRKDMYLKSMKDQHQPSDPPKTLLGYTLVVFCSGIAMMALVVGENRNSSIHSSMSIARTIRESHLPYFLAILVTVMVMSACGMISRSFHVPGTSRIPIRLVDTILLVGCFAGACWMTTDTAMHNNAYFGIWGTVIGASWNLNSSSEAHNGDMHGTWALICLMGSSLVLMIDLVRIQRILLDANDEKEDPQEPDLQAGMILSIVTLVIAGMLTLRQCIWRKCEPVLFQSILFSSLTIMWCVICLDLTMNGPFRLLGNGYFALWSGTLFAFLVAKQSNWKEMCMLLCSC